MTDGIKYAALKNLNRNFVLATINAATNPIQS